MTVRRTTILLALGKLARETWEARTLEELLLELGLGDFNLDSLVDLLLMTALVVGIVLDGGREQRVDESRLSEARLSSNLMAELLAVSWSNGGMQPCSREG